MKRRTQSEEPLRVGMISLGCAKNLVDAEIMIGSLLRDGLEVTHDAVEADVMIVNTCSFIDAAQEESVDTILQSAAVREAHHRGQGLVVSGCLTQRFRDQLPKLMPEVDAFMGIDQVTQVAEIVRQAFERRGRRLKSAGAGNPAGRFRASQRSTHCATPASSSDAALLDVTARPTYIPDYATPRFRLTPNHFAYVKIAEGCNHPCSFCIIPRMRGRHRSRPQPDVVEEVRRLVDEGTREINLISQDTTYYGKDLQRLASKAEVSASSKGSQPQRTALRVPGPTLATLLRDLNALEGDFWVRLLYTHPAHWTDELVHTVSECPKVARYVDMPLQHSHPVMLERMRRETSRAHIEDWIGRIRGALPGVILRTTFIVGFPGESDACFEDLLAFIRLTRFERLGIFTYSQEEKTRAARMSGTVPDTVKVVRRDRAMAEQRRIAREHGARQIGRTMRVLLEQQATAQDLPEADVHSWEHGLIRAEAAQHPIHRGRWTVARGEGDAPDIDGRVYVRGALQSGDFARVKIVDHTDYDLIAEPFQD